ncbi:MAG TPA: L-histidine N(alpha)-methyltransferase [Ramlibacter sp.]|jgi:dimethylhistidine N-methyltransferase|uniref:L-histidine N(alpha)-methyltransferase n=1 Tax=Ramlibacter sp. TaxID=1917967 RepID=UPI002D4B4CC8|nr:L-histidine N(alpha)-methyltransferase [Ramlibacter sp.]HZY20595.1 L-histidine N(alpha)-methyltransferase [Ramlibacter sp.]
MSLGLARATREADPSDTPETDEAGFLQDLQLALSAPPHGISPKYFYDAQGSRLFDRICELPEYYPTRTERSILSAFAQEIAEEAGTRGDLVEFGAGSCSKVRLLLDALRPRRYLPIDISAEHLEQSAAELEREHPGLLVLPVAADYTAGVRLPPPLPGAPRIGFFPGSTIGNFTPAEALRFLRGAARLLRGGGLLLGADLVKDPAVLHAAYNDAQGVTAAFNLNLLARANRELGADFELERFWHSAFFNAGQQRIEMHLVSRQRQQVAVGGEVYELAEGQSLHTENSYKFSIEGLRSLALQAGFRPGRVWTDERRLFSVHWLHAPQ